MLLRMDLDEIAGLRPRWLTDPEQRSINQLIRIQAQPKRSYQSSCSPLSVEAWREFAGQFSLEPMQMLWLAGEN